MGIRASIVAGFVLAAAGVACGAGEEEDVADSDSAITDDELAKKALRFLGAKVPGAHAQCQRCHDVNRATLRKWVGDYKATMDVLRDESKSVDQRIAFMRRDPEDRTSTFAPAKLGFLTAGSHLAPNDVSAAQHPKAAAIVETLGKLFRGRDADWEAFRRDGQMPIEPEYEKLTPTEFDVIAQWIDKGMPKLDELLPEAPRPTSCADDINELRAHASAMKSKNWETINKSRGMRMFACDGAASTLECFGQKHEGRDIFPIAETTDYGRGWARDGSNIRVLRVLDYRTFFWTRASADGRFVANGKGGGLTTILGSAVISDLAAALTPGGPRERDIGASARYDPDFWPDNRGFMFQGTSRNAVFCSMSLLTNPATTKVTFNEPQCHKLDGVGLYQTVGERIGDNSIADYFVVNSKYASDNPGLTARDKDQEPTFGPDAKATVRVMLARGNDADDGYEVHQSVDIPTPFEGDTMMSRSASLIGSRVAGERGALGYSIRKVLATPQGRGYAMQLKSLGRICMPGNKANFSFDERFLTTHHYLTREDFESDAAFAEYQRKGGSDVYVADFVTGKKARITAVKPGQFALYPHFRSDGWLYFIVRDANGRKEYIVASDWALRQRDQARTP